MMNINEIKKHLEAKTGFNVKVFYTAPDADGFKYCNVEISVDGRNWRCINGIHTDSLSQVFDDVMSAWIDSENLETYVLDTFGQIVETVINECCLTDDGFFVSRDTLCYIHLNTEKSTSTSNVLCRFNDIKSVEIFRGVDDGEDLEEMVIRTDNRKISIFGDGKLEIEQLN
jgi:hypothetical protein